MSLQKIGRYEIVSELGRGAMGVVYKAQDPTIGRTVALKTMRLDVHGLETEDMLRRFKNEARAAGVLNHPHIVTIYDAGEHEGIFYIAMEFIEGVTLHEMLAENRVLSAAQTIQISSQICKGLDYAHSMGIIHRDVKPANIMITSSTVKIMDFGIAKAGGGMTSTGQILGTPHYMSPEQVKGKTLDGRSDLFSMGVVLYEMITGEKPFVGQNVTTVIYKIVHETPIAPRDLDVTIHPGLSEVVNKALAKSPDERYQTGADLVRELENYKSAGSSAGATAVLAAPGGGQNDPSNRTQALSGPAVAAVSSALEKTAAEAAPARTKTSVVGRAPATVVMQAKTRNVLVAVLLSVLLMAGLAVGYGYYRYRAAMKVHEADLQLEQQIKAEEAKSLPGTQNAQPQPADAAAQPATSNPTSNPKSTHAAKPAKAAGHQGGLDFTSDPEGAKVEVDGRSEPQWITPFQASNLASGSHTAVFSRDGYSPETRGVEVVAGKNLPVSVQLRSSVSILAAASTPAGAGIWVDGQDTGKTTPAQITVQPGEHKVLLRKPGFKDVVATESFTPGQTLNYAPVLSAQPPAQIADATRQGNPLKRFFGADSIPDGQGLLHIRTVPGGATIIVNGRVAPKKTDVHWNLPPGTYDILLQIDGYKNVHRTVQVKAGQATDLDEILEKQ